MTLSTRMFLWGFGTAVAVAAFVVAAILYGGSYNVAANDPHTSLMRWALERTLASSVSKATENMEAPDSFSAVQAARGAVLFAQSCAPCHGAPGVEAAAWSRGMLPKPPDLADHADHMEAKKAFWIIRNGLKLTGMPSFSDRHNEDELWALTAFVMRLDDISPEQYAELTAPEEPAPAPDPEPQPAPMAEPEPDPPAAPEAAATPETTAPPEPAAETEAAPAERAATTPEASANETAPVKAPAAGAPPDAQETDTPEQARTATPDEAAPEDTARAAPASEEAAAENVPEPAKPDTPEPEATETGTTSQATMADTAKPGIPIPPRMETVQTVTDESKLEPSLRPLPPPPRTDSQWPAR